MDNSPTLLSWLVAQNDTTLCTWHRPWPRFSVTLDVWKQLIKQTAVSPWSLLSLWATNKPTCVHLALRDEIAQDIAVISLTCPDGYFPAVSSVRPAAQRLERAIQDLFGLRASNLADARQWLDHGVWSKQAPLSTDPSPLPLSQKDYQFLPVKGDGVHQIPVGPVHAGIIEPGHFRFHANGEVIVRLEERLGYTHKGVEWLVQGCTVVNAARIISRISGDSTVAYALGFALAIEALQGIIAPPRAILLRALMAEMERIANHLGDIGAICNDAAFPLILTQCHALREQVARAAELCFGHRLMMDRIIPGGITADLTIDGLAIIGQLIHSLKSSFAEVMEIYDNLNSLLDRTVGTGVLSSYLVHRFGAGGFIGRAAMRDFDARRTPSYPPYDSLDFVVPVLETGDVDARLDIRRREVVESLKLLEVILDRLPPGPVLTPLFEPAAGEGMAIVEGFRGDIVVWVRTAADGTIDRCHARDPSWFQWPLLEVAVEGNIVADFPICNKSFNCSYSGHDL